MQKLAPKKQCLGLRQNFETSSHNTKCLMFVRATVSLSLRPNLTKNGLPEQSGRLSSRYLDLRCSTQLSMTAYDQEYCARMSFRLDARCFKSKHKKIVISRDTALESCNHRWYQIKVWAIYLCYRSSQFKKWQLHWHWLWCGFISTCFLSTELSTSNPANHRAFNFCSCIDLS
jgi:hypothetical protein